MRKMRLCKPFTCHTSEPPGWSLNVPAFNFPTVSRSIPFLFKLLRTLLCFSRSTLLFSSNSELFTAKHPAWGTHNVPTFKHSNIQTFQRSPSVPLQPNALGATIRKGTEFLHDPRKQLRSPRCLRLVSGHRGQLESGFRVCTYKPLSKTVPFARRPGSSALNARAL